MQCVNCECENTPGVERCVRCQSRLDLEGVAIGPPRSGRLRMSSRARRLANPVRQGICISHAQAAEQPAVRFAWRPLCWSVLPGLGHVRCGDAELGVSLLVCWLGCLGLVLLAITWRWSWLFVAAAMMVHATALLSLASGRLVEGVRGARALLGALLFGMLWLLVYGPAIVLCERFCVPSGRVQ